MVDPFHSELQELRDKYLYNISPWTQSVQTAAKRGFRLFHSDNEDQDDTEDEATAKALATAYGVFRRRESTSKDVTTAGPTLDIGVLKQQYAKLLQRQRQAHVIISAACTGSVGGSSVSVNQLLAGKSALIGKGRRIGPPEGSVPPPAPHIRTGKKNKVPISGETLHWKDVSEISDETNQSMKESSVTRGKRELRLRTNHDRNEGPRIHVTEKTVDESFKKKEQKMRSSSSSSSSTELCDDEFHRYSDIDSEDASDGSGHHLPDLMHDATHKIHNDEIHEQFSESIRDVETLTENIDRDDRNAEDFAQVRQCALKLVKDIEERLQTCERLRDITGPNSLRTNKPSDMDDYKVLAKETPSKSFPKLSGFSTELSDGSSYPLETKFEIEGSPISETKIMVDIEAPPKLGFYGNGSEMDADTDLEKVESPRFENHGWEIGQTDVFKREEATNVLPVSLIKEELSFSGDILPVHVSAKDHMTPLTPESVNSKSLTILGAESVKNNIILNKSSTESKTNQLQLCDDEEGSENLVTSGTLSMEIDGIAKRISQVIQEDVLRDMEKISEKKLQTELKDQTEQVRKISEIGTCKETSFQKSVSDAAPVILEESNEPTSEATINDYDFVQPSRNVHKPDEEISFSYSMSNEDTENLHINESFSESGPDQHLTTNSCFAEMQESCGTQSLPLETERDWDRFPEKECMTEDEKLHVLELCPPRTRGNMSLPQFEKESTPKADQFASWKEISEIKGEVKSDFFDSEKPPRRAENGELSFISRNSFQNLQHSPEGLDNLGDATKSGAVQNVSVNLKDSPKFLEPTRDVDADARMKTERLIVEFTSTEKLLLKKNGSKTLTIECHEDVLGKEIQHTESHSNVDLMGSEDKSPVKGDRQLIAAEKGNEQNTAGEKIDSHIEEKIMERDDYGDTKSHDYSDKHSPAAELMGMVVRGSDDSFQSNRTCSKIMTAARCECSKDWDITENEEKQKENKKSTAISNKSKLESFKELENEIKDQINLMKSYKDRASRFQKMPCLSPLNEKRSPVTAEVNLDIRLLLNATSQQAQNVSDNNEPTVPQKIIENEEGDERKVRAVEVIERSPGSNELEKRKKCDIFEKLESSKQQWEHKMQRIAELDSTTRAKLSELRTERREGSRFRGRSISPSISRAAIDPSVVKCNNKLKVSTLSFDEISSRTAKLLRQSSIRSPEAKQRPSNLGLPTSSVPVDMFVPNDSSPARDISYCLNSDAMSSRSEYSPLGSQDSKTLRTFSPSPTYVQPKNTTSKFKQLLEECYGSNDADLEFVKPPSKRYQAFSSPTSPDNQFKAKIKYSEYVSPQRYYYQKRRSFAMDEEDDYLTITSDGSETSINLRSGLHRKTQDIVKRLSSSSSDFSLRVEQEYEKVARLMPDASQDYCRSYLRKEKSPPHERTSPYRTRKDDHSKSPNKNSSKASSSPGRSMLTPNGIEEAPSQQKFKLYSYDSDSIGQDSSPTSLSYSPSKLLQNSSDYPTKTSRYDRYHQLNEVDESSQISRNNPKISSEATSPEAPVLATSYKMIYYPKEDKWRLESQEPLLPNKRTEVESSPKKYKDENVRDYRYNSPRTDNTFSLRDEDGKSKETGDSKYETDTSPRRRRTPLWDDDSTLLQDNTEENIGSQSSYSLETERHRLQAHFNPFPPRSPQKPKDITVKLGLYPKSEKTNLDGYGSSLT